MRESLGEGAPALLCSGVVVLAMLPVADVLRDHLAPLSITVVIGSAGLLLYAACLRVISPAAWGDLRTLFVRVLGAGRLLPLVRNAPQRV